MTISTRTEPGSASAWPAVEAPRRAKGAATVSASEYDFSRVPDGELRACVHYEYARESANIAKIVEGLRTQFRERMPQGDGMVGKTFDVSLRFTRFTKTHSQMHDGWYQMALAARKEFPRVAWLELKAKEREMLKGFPGSAVQMGNDEVHRKYPAFVGDPAPDAAAFADVTLGDWEAKRAPAAYRDATGEWRRKWLLSGFFMVNLGYRPDDIVQRFRKWLLKRHPEAGKPAPEKRGRNSYRDRLNALGAMRLRFYCRTLREAQALAAPLQKKEHGLYYSDRTAWNRACTRAVDYFHEVLDVKETDLPIHYSKGWQK